MANVVILSSDSLVKSTEKRPRGRPRTRIIPIEKRSVGRPRVPYEQKKIYRRKASEDCQKPGRKPYSLDNPKTLTYKKPGPKPKSIIKMQNEDEEISKQ